MPDPRAIVVLLKVAQHPFLQTLGLAHIQQPPLRIEIAVHAGQQRQGSDLGEQLGAVGIALEGSLLRLWLNV